MRSITPARVVTPAIRRNEVSADLPRVTLTSGITATKDGSENGDNLFSMTHSDTPAGGSESDSEPEADLPDIPYSDSPVDGPARVIGASLQQSANQTDARIPHDSPRPSEIDTSAIIRASTSKSVLDAVIVPALSIPGGPPRYSSKPLPVTSYFTSRHRKLQPHLTHPPSTVVQDIADEVQVLTRSSSVRVTEPSNQPSITKAPTPVHQAPTTINATGLPNRESPSIFIDQPEAKSPIVKRDAGFLETELTTLQTSLRQIRTQLSAQNRKLENVSISRNKAIQRSSVLDTRRRTLLTKRKLLEDRITSNRDDVAQQKTIVQRTGMERDKVMQETDKAQGELDHLMSRSREVRREMGLSEERIRQEEMCDQEAWSSMEGDDAGDEESHPADSMDSASEDTPSSHGDAGSELTALPRLATHDDGLVKNFRATIDKTEPATHPIPPQTIDISQLNQHIKAMEDHRKAAEMLLNRCAELKNTSALDLLTNLPTSLPTTTTPTMTMAVSKKRRMGDIVFDTDTDTDDDWIHKVQPNKPSRGQRKRRKTAEGTHSASQRTDDAVAEDLFRLGERGMQTHALLSGTEFENSTDATRDGQQSGVRDLGIEGERKILLNKKSSQSNQGSQKVRYKQEIQKNQNVQHKGKMQDKQNKQNEKRKKREITDPVGAAKTGASYWFC